MVSGQGQPEPTVGAKIAYLFEHRRRADGKRYTYAQVEEAIASYGQASVGASYLCRLRTHPEKRVALSPARAQMIARFFRVDESYFDPECQVNEPPWLELAAVADSAGTSGTAAAADEIGLEIYARGLGMSPTEKKVLLKMADVVKQIVAEAGLGDRSE
jgi:hypothetical protein